MGTAKAREKIRIKGYIGGNGSGKTFKMMQDAATEPRQIRLRLNNLDPTLSKGAEVIDSPSLLLKYASGRIRENKPFSVCYDVASKYDHFEAFAIVSHVALSLPGQVAVLGDEAHRYCKRDFAKSQPFLEVMLTQGFHYRAPFYWTATAPRRLPPEFRSQSHELKIFANHDTAYLSYIEKIAKELVEPLRDAPPYSYILVKQGKRPELVRFRGKVA